MKVLVKNEITLSVKTFPDTLRAIREYEGVSRQELCFDARFSSGALANIENGVHCTTKGPTLGTMITLFNVLGWEVVIRKKK